MGFLSDLFDPGRGSRDAASAIANSPGAQVTGGQFRGGLGVGGSFGFVGPDQRFTSNSTLGQLQRPANLAIGTANRFLGGGGATDLGFLENLAGGSVADLQNPNLQSQMFGAGGLQSLFSSALPVASANPFQLGAGVTENLRAQALPEQQRAVNSTLSRLFAGGRLGTTGGANIIGRLGEAQNQQDLQFQLAGLEAGRGLQQDATGRLLSGFGGLESQAGRLFGEQATGAQLGGQFAQARFGVGSSLADTLMQNLVTGQNIGISGLGAATGLAQLPLAFQNAALNASVAQSNANLSRAGVQQNNAAMAKSPLLEAVNAVGQFFQPIKIGGG